MLKKYFKENCIHIRQWAKKHGLKEITVYKVISGEITGKKSLHANTRAVFETLLAENIIDELPDVLKDSDKKAS